ncbi:MAG TPA: hypothetical protein VM287_01935 [Egibacteraceae bacterium]|nr:hypothetical protein [Egibacteraceae bacterium]
MRRLNADERGAGFLEFALLLPVLALIVAAAQPLMGALLDHVDVSRAVSAGARYATKVDTNPGSADDGSCGSFSRRRTAQEVKEYVAATSRVITEPTAVEVTTVDIRSGASVMHPCKATATSPVTVSASTTRPSGVLGRAANALSGLVGGDGIFPEQFTISNTATATLE